MFELNMDDWNVVRMPATLILLHRFGEVALVLAFFFVLERCLSRSRGRTPTSDNFG